MSAARGVMVAAHGLVVDVATGQSHPLPDPDLRDVGHLYDRARAGNAASVLVVDDYSDDALELARRRGYVVEQVWEHWPAGWRVSVEHGPVVTVVLLVRDGGMRVAGPWFGLEPAELVQALRVFERFVGVPWLDSIGRTAERLILSTHPRERGGTVLEAAPKMPKVCEEGNLETALNWRRPLLEGERGGRFVHCYDANAQYLAAWISVELGLGEPEHVKAPTFDPKVPGVWRVKKGALEAARAACGPLPAPWGDRHEWFTTPTLARAVELAEGVPVAVSEAWCWPRHSRYLRAAAEAIRDARAALLDELAATRDELTSPALEARPELVDGLIHRQVVAGAALDAAKALYRVQTGRFNMAGRDERSIWRRPDWGHAVRALARCNLHRRLAKLSALPVAIATDGLVFVDDEPDGRSFADRIGLPVGAGLGHYSHELTMPATPALLEAIEAASSGPRVFAAIKEANDGAQ